MCADHLQRGRLEGGEITLGAVLEQQALVAAVVGFAHAGLHADFGGHAAEQQMRDAAPLQRLVQAGGVEHALAGLVDDEFALDGRQRVDDLAAGFAAHQDAAHRSRVADAQRRAAAVALGGRTVGEIGQMRLARVHDPAAGAAPGIEHGARGRHDGFEQRHVVAQRLAEAAGFDEITLHVDEDQRGARQVEFVGKRPGVLDAHEGLSTDGLVQWWPPPMCAPST
jgi:hypothetical protein